MRFLPLCFLLAFSLYAQNTLQLIPGVIVDCTPQSLGREHVVWNAPGVGSVQVRIGAANGVPMTVFSPPQGSADTGNWVNDGMIFVLVDANSNELARAVAAIRCSPFPDPSIAGLAASSYFPLQVGNEWVYVVNDRTITGGHQTRRVTGTQLINGQVWYNVAFGTATVPYREDEQGRIYYMDSLGHETLLLDPTPAPDPSAQYKILSRGQRVTNALGSFPDSLSYQFFNLLTNETGVYIRGIGLMNNGVQMLSGSSGGFLSSLSLIYARIGGNLRFATPAVYLGLSVESTDPDVTGQHVSNCAVPCYFVACGLVPGTDPPGTYKPCFETRVRLENLPIQDSTVVDLSLLDSSNRSVVQVTTQVAAGQAQPDSILVQQIPLYTAPNAPVLPGLYRVQAKATLSNGAEPSVTTIPIVVH